MPKPHEVFPEILLNEVFLGKFENFRTFVNSRNLSEFDLSNRDLTKVNLGYLSQALHGTPVTTLTLIRNKATIEGLIALTESLAKTNVTKLAIINHNIKEAGVEILAEKIARTKEKYLDLRANGLSASAIKFLMEKLVGSCVVSLNLSGNKIDDQSLQLLAQNLKATKIQSMALCLCNLTLQGIIYFIRLLKVSIVESIDLRCNKLNGETISQIIPLIAETSLTHILLDAIDLSPRILKPLKTALNDNAWARSGLSSAVYNIDLCFTQDLRNELTAKLNTKSGYDRGDQLANGLLSKS
jgi:hypothetical protein